MSKALAIAGALGQERIKRQQEQAQLEQERLDRLKNIQMKVQQAKQRNSANPSVGIITNNKLPDLTSNAKKTSDSIKNLISQKGVEPSTSFLTGNRNNPQTSENMLSDTYKRDSLTGNIQQERYQKTSEKKNLADYGFDVGKYRKAEQENYKKNKELAMQDDQLLQILSMDQSDERDAAKDKYMQDSNIIWRLNELRNKNHKTIEDENELEQLEFKLLQLNNLRRNNDTLVDDAILDIGSVVSNTYNSAAYNADLLLQSVFNKEEKLVDTRNSDIMNAISSGRMDTSQALSESYGDWAGFLYQVGLSISDNLALRVLDAFVPGASLIAMSSNAAASKAYEVGMMKDDATAFEQLGRGLMSGGIEYLTEKISFDSLNKLMGKKNSRNILRGMVDQAIEEGREEGLSYVLNLAADALWGDKVEWNWGEFLSSVLGGAISGGVMGGPGTYIGNLRFEKFAASIKSNSNVQQAFKDYCNIEDVSAMTDTEFSNLLSNSFEDMSNDLGEKTFNSLSIDQIMALVPNYMTKGEHKMWDAGKTLDFKQAISIKSADPFTSLYAKENVKQQIRDVAKQYNMHERTVELIAGIVDKYDVNVVFTTDMQGKKNADGYYQNGTIYINPNGNKPYMQTIKHELTHHIQYNPEFSEIKNFLISEYQATDASEFRRNDGKLSHYTFDDLVKQTTRRYMQAGVYLSNQDYEFETLADLASTSSLFADEKGLNELADIHTDTSMKQKIADFFDKMASRFSGNSLYQNELEHIRDVYINAINKNFNNDFFENMDINGFTVDKSKISYSVSKDAFSNIELLKKGQYNKNAIELKKHTPYWLLHLGYHDYPMFMRTSHILSNVLSEEEAKELGFFRSNANYHAIDTKDFLKMVDSIDNPKAAFEWVSGNKDNPMHGDNEIVIIGKWKYKGFPFVVTLKVDEKFKLVEVVPSINTKIVNNINTNYISSTYPKQGKDPMLIYLGYEMNGSVKRLDIAKKKPPVNVASNSPIVIEASSIRNITQSNDLSSDKKKYSISSDTKGRSLSKQQQEFYKDVSPMLKDENGNLKVYYHGTARADRVGTVFDPERATSGPMAFFTDNESIARNYATDKNDTSIAYDERYDDYYSQFRIDYNGKDISIPEYWDKLSFAEKNRIKKLANEVKFDDDYENIIVEEGNMYGNGGLDPYTIKENNGNMLKALVQTWLESGDLLGREKDFLQVLEAVGIKGATYLDPEYRDEKVYEVYLNIKNPLDTSELDMSFADGLEEWINTHDMSVYQKESSGADMWDKNNVNLNDWIDKLIDDIENNTTHVWTSIPDAVTAYLKEQGYDGISDTGGKRGGNSHQVVIPFESNQVKYVDNQNPTQNDDIRFSISNKTPVSKYTDEVKRIMKKYGSLQMMNAQEVDRTISDIVKRIADDGKYDETQLNDLISLVKNNVMADNDKNNGEFDVYDDILKNYKGTRIYVDEKYRNFIKNNNIINKLKGVFTITYDKNNSDTTIDRFYNDVINEYYKGYFDQVDTEEDQLLQLSNIKDLKMDDRKRLPINQTNEYLESEEYITKDITDYLDSLQKRINSMPENVKNKIKDVSSLNNAEKYLEKNHKLQDFKKFYFNNINANAAKSLNATTVNTDKAQKLLSDAIDQVYERGDISNNTRNELIDEFLKNLNQHTNKYDEYTEQLMNYYGASTDETFKSI
ncbi:MAG: hypothetical protein PUF50_03565, partial [Erysipelotrichaceae bacterium]|nr:hypothetical protein [Erysipelotrichaceae bacterium]